jgi:hypothetical protein
MQHGQRWGAIQTEDENYPISKIKEIAANTSVLELANQFSDNVVCALKYGDGPVVFLLLVELLSRKMISLYPAVLNHGANVTVTILEILEEEGGNEAMIKAAFGETMDLVFFDPLYFYDKQFLKVGSKCTFNFSIIFYYCDIMKDLTLEIDKGPMLEMEKQKRMKEDPAFDPSELKAVTLSLDGAKAFMQTDDSGDYGIRTKIDNIKMHTLDGMVYFSSVSKIRSVTEEEFDIVYFGFKHSETPVLPAIGDNIDGAGWLQGHLVL